MDNEKQLIKEIVDWLNEQLIGTFLCAKINEETNHTVVLDFIKTSHAFIKQNPLINFGIIDKERIYDFILKKFGVEIMWNNTGNIFWIKTSH